MTTFYAINLTGKDAAKFLQGQLTINVNKLNTTAQATAICNLKGRVQFGLWVKQQTDDNFLIITSADCLTDLIAHIKKYGAFSKITISEPSEIYPSIINGLPDFDEKPSQGFDDWAKLSICLGNYWITAKTSQLFQPQELRLHQRGGVDYDKGCYLGQEIIARLYFKASPKTFLHRVLLNQAADDGEKINKIHIVNQVKIDDGFDSLVIGSPEDVAKIGQILPLPDKLMEDVARH